MNFKSIFFLSFLFISLLSFSQSTNPYTISYAVSKTDYKPGDTIEFIINIQIADGWELYSTEFPADGPIKFEFNPEPSPDYHQAGVIQPFKPYTHYDEIWGANVKIFEKVAQLRVPIVVKKAGKINFKASMEGQFCKDACINMKENVALDLSTLKYSDYIAADASVYAHFGKEPEVKKKSGRKSKSGGK